MAVRRHTVRKVKLARPRSLDERLWPVLLGIWGLTLYVLALFGWMTYDGTPAGTQRGIDGASLAAGLATLASLAVAVVSPRRLRRGMVLALCVSLAINLSLMVGLSYVRLVPPRPPAQARVPPAPETPPERTFEEYYPLALEGDDRPEQAEDQPVSTGEPEWEPRDLIRKTSVALAEPLPLQADAVPETVRPPSLAAVQRDEFIESAPRRVEWQGTLSRQELSLQPILGHAGEDPTEVSQQSLNPASLPNASVESLAPFRSPPSEQPSPTATARMTRQATMPILPAESTQEPSDNTPGVESLSLQRRRTVSSVPTAEVPVDPAPPRPPASSAYVAPARVDVPPIEPVRPDAADPDASPVPLPRRTSLATGERSFERPASPPPSREPSVESSLSAELKRADLPGVADLASQPSFDLSPALSGSAVEQMTSPLNRPLPSVPARRRPLTGRLRPMGSHVDLPQPGPTEVAETPAASPAEVVSKPEDSPLGPAHLSEIVSQPGGAPVEVGTRNPLSPAPSERASGGGLPEVVQSASERLTTSRVAGGDYQPALPTEVERPDVAVPTERAGPPAVTSLASDTGSDPRRAPAAVPRAPAASVPTELPPANVPLAPAQPTRVPRADEASPRLGAPALAVERTTPVEVVRPQPEAIVIPWEQPERVARSTPVAPPVAIDRPPRAEGAEFGPPGEPGMANQEAGGAEKAAVGPLPAWIEGGVFAERDVTALPTVADDIAARVGTGPRRLLLSVPRDVETQVEAPPAPTGRPVSVSSDRIEAAPTDGPIARRGQGALPVETQAGPGLGGLSSDISTDVGLLHRQAQPESDQVVDSVGRFLRRPVGGPLSINSQVPIPARAYETRMNRQGQKPVGGNGRPSPRTEEAIELGLLYLAQHQRADGSWSLAEAGEPAASGRRQPLTIQSDSAASGLALLAFLGAGYHHRSEKYGDVVQDGLEYLLEHQQSNGDLYVRADAESNRSAWLYSHAIASIALCEAFGMTQDPELRDAAQRAVDFIVQAQHPERGGWRYAPGVGSDTSVSGWMVMALRSAELANLRVPVETWQRVDVWLEMAKSSDDRPELYRYNPLAPNTISQGHGRRPTKTITAVGLLMRLYTGWRRDDLQMVAGADYLMNNLPELGSVRDPQRDTYYWYYATQVMFHMRGQYWERWNAQLHELLTSTQSQTGPLAGSWDPWRPLPDRWAPGAGRLYVTTMNLLSLEVYYRHLPIYEDTSR